MGIREIRRIRNITQQQLADEIGVNFSTISKYESGKVTPPADKLAQIAVFLDVSADSLMDSMTPEAVPRHRPQTKSSKFFVDNYIGVSEEAAMVALQRSNGYCDLCGCSAPFNDPNGLPHLEAHYIVPLSEGGWTSPENVAMLCPNCLARIKVLHDDLDTRKLLEKVAKAKQN